MFLPLITSQQLNKWFCISSRSWCCYSWRLMTCAFSEEKDQGLSCLFAEHLVLWVRDDGLQKEWWCCLERRPCATSSLLTLLTLASSHPPPLFCFTELYQFVTWSQRRWKQSVSKGWCSLRSGARKLLEKYPILANTENKIKHYVRDYFHFGHCKRGENYILTALF